MKVAVLGRSVKAGSFVAHIADAFDELGHQSAALELRMVGEPRRGRLANLATVARTDIVSRSPRAIRALYRSTLGALRASRPDLIVTTLGRVTREEVDSWREVAPQARVVLWFPDAVSNFGRQQAFGAGLDRLYVKDPYLLDRVGTLGGVRELRYLPEGAPSDAVDWLAEHPEPRRSAAVAMVGNIYPSRVRFLEELIGELPVEIYGRLHNDTVPEPIVRSFTGRYLSGADKYQVFRDARGVLNNLHYAEVGSVNYRLFEAAACRGVVLVDDVPQVSRYFEPGAEVITFRSVTDLVKTLGDLSDADLAAIGGAAHARVTREHLIRHRLEAMLEDLAMT